MPELHYELEPMPSADQLAFIEQGLRASFKIDHITAGDGRLAIAHAEAESTDAIRAMVRRFVFISKNVNKDLVFHNDVPAPYADDPQPDLERRGDVIPLQPGFYTLQGDFLRVFQSINRSVRDIAEELGAIEQEHPAVWPVRLFRMIDYFHEFPQQMILCAPVKDDFGSRKAFAERFRKDRDFDTVPMDELMADASYGLQPAVCDCCYYGLEGRRDHVDGYYTTYNKVFRNERSATNRLDRLTNFSVRDIMFVGSEAFVLEARQGLIERLSRLLQALQVSAKIETANDPFFANDSAMKSVFQTAHRLKYELLADIPHLGKSIAVGSINLHTDFFGKAFDIRTIDGSVAHSGCIGVGMERMTYALFCQYGPELAKWPPALHTFLGLDARAAVR
jgi:seryl-tRNA synthetase